MASIVKATEQEAALIAALAARTFIESHGNSAQAEDIDAYIATRYHPDLLKRELADPGNLYHLLYYDKQVAGYSKIILNQPYPGSDIKGLTKLERLYLLSTFYNQHLGQVLFDFNIHLAKTNGQQGVWLFVWKENLRAIRFYKKNGFRIIGSHDFEISKTHSNPNHLLLLEF
ncbi:GNAT family N-acetyltransferase [Niabella beijingensis]|uniref:GNAT family N-acetyltransferase n=1 Tax=Niabella beijingensis TaxID=2872700 RepID=UPI001CBF1B82|nr:GNAT family N-acetyltransferase [Niabella beijingensis]MBZ4192236.1 GNAT family N-acetyltransferase [Niabella beijingensis]